MYLDEIKKDQITKALKNGIKLDKVAFADTNSRILLIGIIISIVIQFFFFNILVSFFLIILFFIEILTIRIVSKVRNQMIKEYNKNY